MKEYPKSVSEKCTEKILEQMKNSFYKVYNKDGKSEIGIGFFSYIEIESKNVPIIIINSTEIYKEDIGSLLVSKNNAAIEIQLGETRFKDKILNMAVFEIKQNGNIKTYS